MHLLLIHQNFPSQFRDLGPAWLAAGHQISAIGSLDDTSEVPDWEGLRYWNYTIETQSAEGPKPLERGRAVAHVARHLLRHSPSPDLVLVHSGWGEALQLRQVFPRSPLVAYPELWGTPAALGFGIDPDVEELLPTLHQEDLLQALRHPIERQNLLADLAITQADAAVVPSPSQLASLPAALQMKTRLIAEGVDTARLQPDPHARFQWEGLSAIRPGDPLVTLVSRALEPLRGLRAALRAWPEVVRQCPDARLLLVGGHSGGYGWETARGNSHLDDALQCLPDRPENLGIHVLGTLPYNQLIQLFQCTACHLGLSYAHTLSWSLLEAMACGAAVISNHGSPLAPLIRSGDNGLLVPFGDHHALSEGILQLLNNSRQRERIGSAARQLIVEHYSLDQALKRYETLFQELTH